MLEGDPEWGRWGGLVGAEACFGECLFWEEAFFLWGVSSFGAEVSAASASRDFGVFPGLGGVLFSDFLWGISPVRVDFRRKNPRKRFKRANSR